MKIQANGLAFNIRVEGDGPPVLMLHGFPDSLNLWKDVSPYLVQDGFRVVAYDQRGYGESTAPVHVDAYRVEHIISDALEILKNLKLDQGINLVGHDWGAVIGWLLCLKHPQLFRRFVAVSVGHPLAYRHAGWEQKLKAWYILAFQIPGLAEAMLTANNWQRFSSMYRNTEEIKNHIRELSRPGRLTAALNWYRANLSFFVFEKFGKCRVPTMGIYSPGDVALTEKQMTDSKKYLESMWSYVQIDDSTHWIPLDQPQELAYHICSWFRED